MLSRMDPTDVKISSSKVSKCTDTQDDLSKRLDGTKLTDSKIVVPEMLNVSEDFVELRSCYVDIVRNMPDDYFKTVQLLENHLCDLHISEVFECTSALDANQKIVMCLLEKANYKADVLDFCEALVSLKASQLVNAVENLRRAVMQNLRSPTEDTAKPMQAGQKSFDVTAKTVASQVDKSQLDTSVQQQTQENSYSQQTTEASNATSTSLPKSEASVANKQEPTRHPPSTTAALKAFDEYFTVMHTCLDPFKFIPKCIAHEIIEGDMYASGASVFLANDMKMEPVLAEIRKFICLNGIGVFEKLLKVLRSEPIYKELADCMEGFCLSHKNPMNKEPPTTHDFKDPEDGTVSIDSQPVLEIFDQYRDHIRNCVEIDIFTAKCEQYGVLECTPITGASVYLPDDVKKDLVLPAIRKSIALNGTQPFLKMLKVLESMSHSRQLAIELQGAFKRHNVG